MVHNSVSLKSGLSPAAADSLEDFQKEYVDEFRYHSTLLRRLIPFITDKFDVEVDLNFLPTNEKSESQDEEIVRRVIIGRLLREFGDMNWDINHSLEDENDAVDYRLLVKVFYWHLNRQPRRPSNLDRLGHVETRAQRVEKAREKFDIKPRSLLEIQRKTIQQHIQSPVRKRAKGKSRVEDLAKKELSDISESEPVRLAPLSKKNELEAVKMEPEGIPIVFDAIGPIDWTMILDNKINQVTKKYATRYGLFLESESGRNLKAILEGNLNPRVKSICETGEFVLDR